MNTNNKIPKYVLASLLLIGLTIGVYGLGASTAPSSGVGQSAGYTGMVNVKHLVDGVVVSEETSHNILFLVGKNFTTSQLFSMPSAAAANPIDNISLGNGTSGVNQIYTAANFGGIPDCGLDPSNPQTWISIANATTGYIDASGNVSTNKLWTTSCGSGTVYERVNQTMIGLTTSAFALNAFTDVYLQSADQLNVTWYVWIT